MIELINIYGESNGISQAINAGFALKMNRNVNHSFNNISSNAGHVVHESQNHSSNNSLLIIQTIQNMSTN